MSCVLYYSKYCDNCKKILFKIGKDKIKDDIHFLCIDKRKKVKASPFTPFATAQEAYKNFSLG